MSKDFKVGIGYTGTGYSFSTHQPLIRLIMELYTPKFVLELGIGEFSTPLFLEYNTQLLSVEDNEEWVKYIKNKYKDVNIIHHKKGNISRYYDKLAENHKKEIINFYKNLNIPILKPNLLFIDQWSSCRLLSINNLKDKFDFVIYHDAQPNGKKINRYDLINNEGFNTYYLKTLTTWAAVMIRNEIDKGYDILKEIMKIHIQNYQKENIMAKSITFEK